MRKTVVLIVLMSAMTGLAWGQKPPEPQPSKAHVATKPDWLKQPTDEDLFSAWPDAAKGREGRAVIHCIVTPAGTVRQCSVAFEKPAGAGYGSAALTLAPQFIFKPATLDGKPVESDVNIPINFSCGGHCPTKLDMGPGTRVVTGLYWNKAPTYQDFVQAYPAKARAKHVAGTASLQCTIEKTGGLTACVTMSENPSNLGFGRAAISLAKGFKEPFNFKMEDFKDKTSVRLTFAFATNMLDGGTPIIGKPKWATAPTMAQMIAAYPKAALEANVLQGRATVRCTVAEGGTLTNCTPATETPVGMGFGAAVVSVMPFFHLATWTEEGLPVVGGEVRVPMAFNIKDAPAPATAKPN